MSRKYLNNRWCVRCGKTTPTPYIEKNYKLLPKTGTVLDIGCGNGRNSKFFRNKGYSVIPIDMVRDYGHPCILGVDKMPAYKYDIILANYIFMFLNKKERINVFEQINQLAGNNCHLIIECYAAKDAFKYQFYDFIEYFIVSGWKPIRCSESSQKAILRLDKNTQTCYNTKD